MALDGKSQRAWMGHPAHFVFRNSDHAGFDAKIEAVLQAALRAVGEPARATYCGGAALFAADLPAGGDAPAWLAGGEATTVKTDFLRPVGGDAGASEWLVQRTAACGALSYELVSEDRRTADGVGVARRRLAAREHEALLRRADPERSSVVQRHRFFLWGGEAMAVRTFVAPAAAAGLGVLACYGAAGVPAALPEGLAVGPRVAEGGERSLRWAAGLA